MKISDNTIAAIYFHLLYFAHFFYYSKKIVAQSTDRKIFIIPILVVRMAIAEQQMNVLETLIDTPVIFVL